MNKTENAAIKTINRPEELAAFKDHWNELAVHNGAYLPYLCYEWFDLWLKHFLQEDELFAVLLYVNDKPAAIAPCVCKRDRFKKTNVRKIELLGNVYSPFRYIVLGDSPQELKVRYLALVLDALSKANISWDMMDFSAVPEEKACFDVLKEAAVNARLKPVEYDDFGDWYVDNIEVTGEEYIAGLPRKIRKDVAYCRRRLEKYGHVDFRVIETEDDVQKHIGMYYQVYGKSWQKTEKVGPTFHRDFARVAASKGWLRLGFLLLDGAPISSQFWITCEKTSFILKTVYDQAFKKYSPGKVLTAEMLKYVIDVDKVTSVDYVQGDEPYKKDWTPMRRERKGLLVFNENLKGRYLALLTRKILPMLNKYDVFRRPKEVIKALLP